VSVIEATVENPEGVKKLTRIGFAVGYENPWACSLLVEQQWRTIAVRIKEMGMKVN
jgi:hypothetical protein